VTTQAAYHALRAAQNADRGGMYAAMRYAQRHNVERLFALAMSLERNAT